MSAKANGTLCRDLFRFTWATRQDYFLASLPTDKQCLVSRLYSGSSVDLKSPVKRIAIHVRGCVSQLLVVQGRCPSDAFCQNYPGGKTSGRDVVGRLAKPSLKIIHEPI